MTKEKVLFISDTSDGQNWGCHATSNKLRNIINKNYLIDETIFLKETSISPNEFIRPNIYDIKYLISEYSKVATRNISFKNIYQHGIKSNKHLFDCLPKTTDQFEQRADYFMEISELNDDVDHVIINGEGSIHDVGAHNYRRKSWSLLFLAYVYKHKLDKNVHIVNHTLDFQTKRFRSIVELVYPNLDTIIFRDPLSFKKYTELIDEENVVRSSDAAWLIDDLLSKTNLNMLMKLNAINFWHPTVNNYRFDFTNPYICIGLGSGFEFGEKLVHDFTILIRLIQDKIPELNIILTAASSGSELTMLKISEKTDLPLLKIDNNYRVSSSIVGNSELYLGGRWHVSIFSLIGGAKIVNFSGNTFKIESLKEEIEGDYPIFNSDYLSKNYDRIVDSVINSLNNDKPILHEDKIVELRSLAYNNINLN